MSKASREVANFIREKIAKKYLNFVNILSLSVCQKFNPNYISAGYTEWTDFFLGHLEKYMSQKMNHKRARAGAHEAAFCPTISPYRHGIKLKL